MKKQHFKRLLSLALAIVMCLGLALPASASQESGDLGFTVEKVDNSAVSVKLDAREEMTGAVEEPPLYGEKDNVRVSIVLSDKSTLEMATLSGISTKNITGNAEVMSYRQELAVNQDAVASLISAQALDGQALDVVWNLTLAANIISANVQYGQIEAIKRVPGVEDVFVETRYDPTVVTKGGDDPNMATSSEQIGSTAAYLEGYYGAGSRIAVIDTGTDTDHQSFDNDAFLYALEQNAAEAGMTYDDYVASLDLLDAAEIAEVYSKLNISSINGLTPAMLYDNEKLAFNFNYIDVALNVTHDYDQQGEHGSHVAGIATANRYIPDGNGGYEEALESVYVQGVAPDAQLITMKVFGADGGAYDSDYMVAIEDAIILGADAINLSLGSTAAGMTTSSRYQDIMDMLSETDTVVVISAGNNGSWADNTYYSVYGYSYLYADDVGFHTGGSPGTFTNSLGVASVDNSGYTTALCVEVGGQNVTYAESTGYGNAALTTLAGEQEFVFVNGIGTAEDFANVDVEGKIALCYRGTTSFFEKANAAVAAGAIGVIVVNNQSGAFYMNLTGYNYTAPVVSITMDDGELFKTNAVEDGSGNVLYWTGTVTVNDQISVGRYNSDYYTMSSFSSWGVPGDLSIKPEITAPGGSIYSVFGSIPSIGGLPANTATDQYELMSGTSMAAPQVTGMMALLMQYIRENDLSVDGLTDRALAQSLLMSTAEPIIDGNTDYYYSVLQQGAGLANIGAAIQADSYILMDANATDSAADGKVKVELGDDPDKTGEYSFSFTINNMTDEEQSYALSADLFTQNLWNVFLDTWTIKLDANVTWLVEGAEMEVNENTIYMDFNGDGSVDTADGQTLLDYATGKITIISNGSYADLNGDGEIGSYDAYLFLSMLESNVVYVPANGSVSVAVEIELNDANLDNYANGAYIEGYVFVEGLATEEGVAGEVHSIPVLGFYGNWTDPSMYEQGSYWEAAYGQMSMPPYLYDVHGAQTNMMTVKYAGDSSEYIFGGNPVVSDGTYMPERNALNNANGDQLAKYYFTPIRNAGNALYLISDAETGVIYDASELGAVTGAYYSPSANGGYGAWYNSMLSLNTGFTGAGLAEGTVLNISLVLAPELYASADGSYDWNTLLNTLGDGAWLTTQVTIDNTAPELVGNNVYTIDEDTHTMTVNVRDNQYVAGIALYDQYGQHLYTYQGADQTADAGDTIEYVLDLSSVNGAEFLLQVYDYAYNTTTYRIVRTIGTVTNTINSIEIISGNELPNALTAPNNDSAVMQKGNTIQLAAYVDPIYAVNRDVTWASLDPTVAVVDQNGVVTAVGAGETAIAAISSADETKYDVCAVEVIDISVDMNGIVWDEEGSIWFSQFNTANLPNYTKLSGDMLESDYFTTAAVVRGQLYASTLNTSTGTGSLYTVDVYTVNSDTAYEATKLASCAVGSTAIFYADLAYSPALGLLMGTYGPYVVLINPTTGAALGVFNWCSNKLVGIAYAQSVYNSYYGAYVDVFFLLDDQGNLYQEGFINLNGDIYNFYGEENAIIGDTGISTDLFYFQSMYLAGDYLFISNFVEANDYVALYAVDVFDSGNIYKLGQFADGVWPVGGLYDGRGVTDPNPAGAASLYGLMNMRVAEEMTSADNAVLEPVSTRDSKSAGGSLNSVANYTAPANPRSTAGSENDQRTVVVTTTAKDSQYTEVASTNGVQVVSYDPEKLTLVSVVVNGEYKSVVHDEATGTVTIGYVSMAGIPAGDTVATLTFTVNVIGDHDFTVNYEETNDEQPGVVEDVALGHEHVYGDWYTTRIPSATEAGEERRDCAYCDHYETQLIPVLPGPGGTLPTPGPVAPGPTLPSGGSGSGESGGSEPTEPELTPKRFIDVDENDWFAEAVDYVSARGIVTGMTENEFRPQVVATRAMIWTMLARMDGESTVGGEFWYSVAQQWAIESGISDGTNPASGVTREQLVTMLWRYVGEPEYDYDITGYVDDDKISDWAYAAMEWAVGTGVMTGMGGGVLNPQGEVTRAQLAQFIMNFMVNR